MASDKKNKFLEFFGFGGADEYEDEEEYFEEEYDAPVRSRREDVQYEEERPRKARKPKVVPMQDRNGGVKSSVVIYSPKTYNDAQPLVMQLIQHKHVIIKLDKVERRVGQRILDFMSGAAYASDAQVTEVSKGSIYLFASNQTYIDKSDDVATESGDDGFMIEEDF